MSHLIDTTDPAPSVVRGRAPMTWFRRSDDAFAAVLEEARAPASLYGAAAGDGVLRLLTLAGRISFGEAIGSLVPWERALVELLLGREDVRLVAPEHAGLAGANVLVVHSDFGKLSLYRRDEELPEGATAVAAMRVGAELLDRADEIAAEEDALERQDRAELFGWLEQLEADGRLEATLEAVIDRVEHVESVYVYVDRALFSRSDVGNTLVRGGVLAALRGKPLAEWAPRERMFVAGFDLLFATGRSIRIEEFNGQEMSARRLREWLLQKLRLYSAAIGERVASGPELEPLPELARRVGALRARLEAGGAAGIRRVNGLTMRKHERVLRLDELLPRDDPQPAFLAASAAELGVDLDARASGREAVAALVRSALDRKRRDPAAEDLERLLERIVVSAVVEGEADYGMSSSVRAPARLAGTTESRPAGILELTKPDFFCACLPHPELVEKLPQDVMFEVLSSVAARMQFNRWHFIPGNFEREEVPDKRHWFFPPLQPDIGEWCDMRHGGHTAASVRYTIRVPGPSLWLDPLRAYGNAFRGFFDIRLVRMLERPFTKRELRVAVRHCLLVDALWVELSRLVEETPFEGPVFTGFERAYYQEEGWRPAVEEAADA